MASEVPATAVPSGDNLVVRSAFAHSLRTNAARTFDEFLQHFTCAILLGKYIVLAQQDPEDAEKMSLALVLPSYDDDSEEGMREGFVVVEEGVDLSEKAREMFEDVAANNTPASMLAEMSKGPLKRLFDFVQSRGAELGGSEDLPAIKRAMTKAISGAMDSLSPRAQALGSARLPDLDPLLAEAEKAIINTLKEETTSEVFKSYFDRILELHAELAADSAAAVEDLMGPAQEHDHDHEDGCCGHEH